MSPSTHEIADGRVRTARTGILGDLVHTLIDTTQAVDAPAVSSTECGTGTKGLQTALDGIDHFGLAAEAGELDSWADFCARGLGFGETHQEHVSTKYSVMHSKVVQCLNGQVRFPMMEPANGERKSQIKRFLESHQGASVQHVAFRSSDIIMSVSTIVAAGLEFLPTPMRYYDRFEERVGALSDIEGLGRLGVLADRDPKGIVLQVSTRPIGIRPTLFLEVVERRGAAGLGSGNIRALFGAAERAQSTRERM
jgi:4-hydroxyphenylpyruvate dioxygenase